MKYNRRYSSIFRVKNKKFVEYQPKWKKREEEEMEMAMQLEKDKAVLRGTKGEGAWDGRGGLRWERGGILKKAPTPWENSKNGGDPTTLAFMRSILWKLNIRPEHKAFSTSWCSHPLSPSALGGSENLSGDKANWPGQDQGEAVKPPRASMMGGRVPQGLSPH